MLRVAIVGSGVAGASTAARLGQAAESIEITVFEREASVGGRAATATRGAVTYDYGANYLSTDDEEILAVLNDVVPATRRAVIEEPIYTFDSAGEITPGRGSRTERWSCIDGIREIPDRLLGASGATVHLEAAIEGILGEEPPWRLRAAGGQIVGPFDVVVLAAPPAACAAILDGSVAFTARGDRSQLRDVSFTSVLSGVFTYPFDIDVPYYALLNTDREHAIGWIARESCKEGHVPAGESVLVVQANPEWSSKRFEVESDAILEQVAGHTASILDRADLADPAWSRLHRWRFAQPAPAELDDFQITATIDGLLLAGDWMAGEGRLEAALESGLAAAEGILLDSV
jgi:predicted NAD/FAD-dependent oxidoreductase